MFKKILVAYDASDYASAAYTAALEIAVSLHAELFVLAVIQLPEPLVGVNPEEFIDSSTVFLNEQFIKLSKQSAELNAVVKFVIVVGRVEEQLINYSQEQHMDLIVMGVTKGRSLIDRLVLGSVSKRVVAEARCSVMVIK